MDLNNYVPHITVGFMASLLGLGVTLWRIVRGVVTKDDLAEVEKHRAENEQVLHDRIDALKNESREADREDTDRVLESIRDLRTDFDGKLDRLDRNIEEVRKNQFNSLIKDRE